MIVVAWAVGETFHADLCDVLFCLSTTEGKRARLGRPNPSPLPFGTCFGVQRGCHCSSQVAKATGGRTVRIDLAGLGVVVVAVVVVVVVVVVVLHW